MVDPDNRQPVNFDARVHDLQKMLEKMSAGCIETIRGLVKNWSNARIKMYLIWKALACRNRHAALFRDGEFLAVDVAGSESHHIMSFVRRLGGQQALIVFPRWVSSRINEVDGSLSLHAWSGINLLLPGESARQWTNIFTGQTVDAKVGEGKLVIPVDTLLSDFPVAMLLPSPQIKSA